MSHSKESRVWKFALGGRTGMTRRSFTAAVAAAGMQAAIPAVCVNPLLGKRKVGYLLPPTPFGERDILELGAAAERAGFTQLLLSAADVTPLTRLSMGAPRLTLGLQADCPCVRQDPIQLAESVARLVNSAPGRTFVGFGLGQSAAEAGLSSWQQHTERMVEAVQIMRWLWSGETVNFNGKHWAIRDTRLSVAPQVAVPVYLAAHGSRTARLVGQYGDGWVTDAEGLANVTLRKSFEEGARTSGRSASDLEVIVEEACIGSATAALDRLGELFDLGATTVLVRSSGDPRREMNWYGEQVLAHLPEVM
jgi:F420-dependent hydroxymycolic acid dehydrogenase